MYSYWKEDTIKFSQIRWYTYEIQLIFQCVFDANYYPTKQCAKEMGEVLKAVKTFK